MKHLLIALVSIFILITVLAGCSDTAKQYTSTTSPSGVVRLSILFPARGNVRTIPDATQSILITVTGTGILANKPFRKGYNRPLPSQPQQVDVELILPLGTKTIRADARDVSASDAEQFNSGNTLATAQQTINFTDANLFEPVTITLDMQVPTLQGYAPTKIKWYLSNSPVTVDLSGTTLPISQTDTQTVYYYDDTNQVKAGTITTTITATLTTIPAVVTQVTQPFDVRFDLTRSTISDIPELVGVTSIHLSIPNTSAAPVSSYISPDNPAKASLLLHFFPVGNGLYNINMTAVPGFSGYGQGVTVINQDQPGGYQSNWQLMYGNYYSGLTLNGNICLRGSVSYYSSMKIAGSSQAAKVDYSLSLNAGFYPNY